MGNKRIGAQRHNYKKQTYLPTTNGLNDNKHKCANTSCNRSAFFEEKLCWHCREAEKPPAEKPKQVTAVHDDRIFDTFDWGAGKNWADHGGRAGRREWMKRGDGEGNSYECKG